MKETTEMKESTDSATHRGSHKRLLTTVGEFLLKHTDVGDVVIFREDGWQIGMTYIDSEDRFQRSLSTVFLNRNLKEFHWENIEWLCYKKCLIIDT